MKKLIKKKLTDKGAHRDALFTTEGTLASLGGAPFVLPTTLDGTTFEGTLAIGGQPPFGIRGERAAATAFDEYIAEQDSLRVTNMPELVDMFEPFDMPTPNEYSSASLVTW